MDFSSTAKSPPSSRINPAEGNLGSLNLRLFCLAASKRASASLRAIVSGDGGAAAATASQLPCVQPHAGVGELRVGGGGVRRAGDGSREGGKKKTGSSVGSGSGMTKSGSEGTGGRAGAGGATSDASVVSPGIAAAVGIQQQGESRTHCFFDIFLGEIACRISNTVPLNW